MIALCELGSGKLEILQFAIGSQTAITDDFFISSLLLHTLFIV